MEQLSLPFDSAAEAREDGIALAREGAEEDWYDRALDTVRSLALARAEFTTDDVWALLESPREPRALGPVMEDARRLAWIVRTDRTRNSTRRECHARPLRVWRSLLVGRQP